MKFFISFVFIILISSNSTCLFGQQGQWTWMKGDTIFNSPGHYGIKGVADYLNTPPALSGTNGWVDQQGNFWMFGGIQNNDIYNDLWKFEVSTKLWTWVNGPGQPNHVGVFGTIGIPADSNLPPARTGFTIWTDFKGDLWLFSGNDGSLTDNDLWRYQIASNQWTWMKGSSYDFHVEHYGTINVSDPENNPPGRYGALGGWVDRNGDLWLFGGISSIGGLNDVWKFNINTNNWTWMAGSDTIEVAPIYGILNAPSPDNTPGARDSYAHWYDSEGKFWLFGGMGGQTYNLYNDLWQFDPDLLQWTWVSGPNTPFSPGSCEQGICVPLMDNIPSCRYNVTACWKGLCDYFYLFGGYGTFEKTKSDLWCYDKSTQKWTFTKGSLALGNQGHHGFPGVPDTANLPRGFDGSCSWTDLNGNFWFFGGRDSLGFFDDYNLNELWRYTPDTLCPAGQKLSNLSITPDTTICHGDTIMIVASGGSNYEWSPLNNISNPYISNPLIYPDSTTVYRVKINIDECYTELYVCIHVNTDSVFSVSPLDTILCKGDSIMLQASGGNSVQWQPASYLSNSTIHNPTAFPDTTITYTVNLVNSCFNKTFTVHLTVLLDTAKRIITADTLICAGQPVSIHAIGGIQYLWSMGQTGDSLTVSPNQQTNYIVTITDIYGCKLYDSILININHLPQLQVIASDTIICQGTSIHLIASGANFYNWHLNETIFDSTNAEVTITPTQSCNYTVVGTDLKNCSDTSSITVEIINCNITIPNVFTPNGDGINDYFHVDYEGPSDYTAKIFNRWGVKLFESHNVRDEWNGKYHETEVSTGTYYYVIGVGNDEYKGTISLLR